MDSLATDAAADAPPFSNGILAVAARIQERAFQLSNERAALETEGVDLKEAKAVLEGETRKNASVRREMLTAVRSLHGAELGLIGAEEEAEKVRREVEEIEEETRRIGEEAQRHMSKWKSIASDVYAKHDVKTELYRRRVEGKIWEKEEKIRERERKLDMLALKADMLHEEAVTMQLERERVTDEIREMDEREEREDEEIVGVAMQIRATLDKVRLAYQTQEYLLKNESIKFHWISIFLKSALVLSEGIP